LYKEEYADREPKPIEIIILQPNLCRKQIVLWYPELKQMNI